MQVGWYARKPQIRHDGWPSRRIELGTKYAAAAHAPSRAAAWHRLPRAGAGSAQHFFRRIANAQRIAFLGGGIWIWLGDILRYVYDLRRTVELAAHAFRGTPLDRVPVVCV